MERIPTLWRGILTQSSASPPARTEGNGVAAGSRQRATPSARHPEEDAHDEIDGDDGHDDLDERSNLDDEWDDDYEGSNAEETAADDHDDEGAAPDGDTEEWHDLSSAVGRQGTVLASPPNRRSVPPSLNVPASDSDDVDDTPQRGTPGDRHSARGPAATGRTVESMRRVASRARVAEPTVLERPVSGVVRTASRPLLIDVPIGGGASVRLRVGPGEKSDDVARSVARSHGVDLDRVHAAIAKQFRD